MNLMRWPALCSLLVLLQGCITTAGGELPVITPPKPAEARSIQYTVGDFEFTLEGGKMVTSKTAGKGLTDEILEVWEDRGYISKYDYVESGHFSGGGADRITLSGSQYGESSVFLQILSGLTLFVLPYTVDTKYDIQFTLAARDGKPACSAEVAASYHTTIELLLIVAAPVFKRGMNQTFEGMADHLYHQLVNDCGFGSPAVAVTD